MSEKEKKKYPLYFYLIAFLIPVLFFIILEGALRISGYGEKIPLWIQPSEKFSDYQMLNPDIARRYFQTLKKIPTPHFDAFRKVKLENTYRVFIMGGSTAAGFPYPMNGAFSRFVKRYLEIQYPDFDIEVINLAISAVNTYTMRDLLPGIIEQKPDLFMIYAGHNEYYGALGAGSSQFWGSSRLLVNAFLDAADIRTLQLLRNIVITVQGWFVSRPVSADDATLMEAMVGQQLIPLHTGVYENGLQQFRGNMTDMMDMLQERGIPVIISTLTANLRDQAPFESAQEDTLPPADQVYHEAQKYLNTRQNGKAGDLYLRAKELDLLRFRAPEAINTIIRDLARTYDIPLVEMDSVFNRHADHGIVGDDLMTDHVHPKIFGIELMGRAFTSVMENRHIVPPGSGGRMETGEAQDIAARTNTMTRLDSVYGELRLAYLKGGWPFKKTGGPNLTLRKFKPVDRIDELAIQVFTEETHWAEAHIKAGLWYKDHGSLDKFEREMLALIEVMPYNDIPFKILIDGLVEHNKLDRALRHLQLLDKRIHSAYSTKWLGIYYLVNNDLMKAEKYLEQSIRLNESDPQVFYNLAGVYINQKDYRRALKAVNRCLAINPDFPDAARTKSDLEKAIGARQ